jgi:glycosyltransferase involved in cell wall biosynthesis
MTHNKEIPLVSVGMPVYNGEKTIGRAIDSLLKQEYKNIEIIISNNASSDGTSEILKKYEARYDFIKVHTQPKNIGIHNNFEFVLKAAKGKYFMWAADDDMWLPEFIEQLVCELENNHSAGAAMCSVKRVKEDGTFFDKIQFLGRLNPNKKGYLSMAIGVVKPIKYNLFICGLFRREIMQSAVKLWERIPAADRWLILHISLATKFRYIDPFLYIRSVHEKPFYNRYAMEEYGKRKLLSELKLCDFQHVAVVNTIILKSEIIPWYRKIYIPIILFCLVYWTVIARVKKIPYVIWYKLKPYCPEKFIQFLWKMKIIKNRP